MRYALFSLRTHYYILLLYSHPFAPPSFHIYGRQQVCSLLLNGEEGMEQDQEGQVEMQQHNVVLKQSATLPFVETDGNSIKMLPLAVVSAIHHDESTKALTQQQEEDQIQAASRGKSVSIKRKSLRHKSFGADAKNKEGVSGGGVLRAAEAEAIHMVEGQAVNQPVRRGTRKSMAFSSSKNVDIANIRFSNDALQVCVMANTHGLKLSGSSYFLFYSDVFLLTYWFMKMMILGWWGH